MKKKLKVERFHFDEKFTIGKLFVDDEDVQIYTLEDKVREIAGKPVSEWKINGKTAIPTGLYKLEFRYSPKFKKVLPHLIDVEGFEYVLIHSGNNDEDTEGCILVGLTWDGSSDFIGSSRVAFSKLMSLIDGFELEIEIV